MWYHFIFLLLVGAAAAVNEDHDGAWKSGYEYQYLVESQTLTGLDKISQWYTGIFIKGVLNIQVKSPDELLASFSNPQYQTVHEILKQGWDKYRPTKFEKDLPLSGKVFQIKLKHGLIREIIIDKNVPAWEVNLLKSIVSQLQVDIQGENARKRENTQVPNDNQPFGMFTTIEETVRGKCEVLYDMKPMSKLYIPLSMVPIDPQGPPIDDNYIDIIKTRNYDKCDEQPNYQFSNTDRYNWRSTYRENNKFISESSINRIVISGNLRRYTIQSSVSRNTISVYPRIEDSQSGGVYSRTNVILTRIKTIHEPWSLSTEAVSAGNLVYNYNNQLFDNENRKTSRYMKVSESSREDRSDVDYYENETNRDDKRYSSEENDYVYRSKMNEAPYLPILPFFVGNKGKNIHTVTDPVQVAKNLVPEIVDDIQNPNEISSRETLEKFTILARLIRTLSTNEILQLEDVLRVSSNKTPRKNFDRETNSWNVLRDAVVQAGTGPALQVVTKWIVERKLEGVSAATVVSQLPKTARLLTEEYVRAFFDMINRPEVLEQQYLNVTAPIAFAELVRLTYSENHNNHYPVRSFNRIWKKDNTAIKTYIPYMADQLKKAVRDGDSTRIQTYIRAVANFGHPKILVVFEPYLEGKQQLSKFQRFLIVLSLDALIETNHEIARSVLYKIYLNTHEAHELRCIAVSLLMKTNPPLSMLKRMAEFTKLDKNQQVNSAVKSILNNLAKMKRADRQDLANKARSVIKLLDPRDYYYSSSHVYIRDDLDAEMNRAITMYISTIGSDDMDLPKTLYFSRSVMSNDFYFPKARFAYMVSSFKNLIHRLLNNNVRDQNQESIVEKIAHALKIEPDDPEQLEGNINFNTKYGTHFYPFDNHTIDAINQRLNLYYQPKREDLNVYKLTDYDVTTGFPTETGLPFIHTFKNPQVIKLNSVTEFKVKKSNNIFSSKVDLEVTSEFDLMVANKVQGRFGFITPFEGQKYIADIDEKLHLYLPLKVDLKIRSLKVVDLKIRLNLEKRNNVFFHNSVVPYISKGNIFEYRPVIFDKNTNQLRQFETEKKPYVKSVSIGSSKISIRVESDEFLQNDEAANLIPSSNEFYRKYEILLNANDIEATKNDYLKIFASYDYNHVTPNTVHKHDYEVSAAKAKIPVTYKQNHNDIKKQYVDEVSKGINCCSHIVHFVNATVSIPGMDSQVFVGFTNEERTERKTRFLMFSNFKQTMRDQKSYFETCVSGNVRSRTDVLDVTKTLNSEQKDEFNVEVMMGENCVEGEKVVIRGNQKRSEDRKRAIQNYEIIEKCQQEMREGNKGLRNCETANIIARARDQYEMTMEFNSDYDEYTNKAVQYFSKVLDTKVALNRNDDDRNALQLKLKVLPDLRKMNITMRTPKIEVTSPRVDIAEFSPLSQFFTLPSEDSVEEIRKTENMCTIVKSKVVTFDGKIYPVVFGECWHVVMTTFPQENPDNPSERLLIPKEQRIAVMIRDVNDGQREVKIIANDKEVKIWKSKDYIYVTVNGQAVDISRNSYQEIENNNVLFEIYKISDDTFKFTSDVYDANVIYNGYFTRVQLSDKYRNSVRGICGNFDRVEDNDFVTPRNCLLKNPEEFVATFAMTEDNCKGLAHERKQKADKATCLHARTIYSNVISDVEAGRQSTESTNWGYHQNKKWDNSEKQCNVHRTKVVEKNEEICISTYPLPTCTKGCEPTRMKMKKYPIYCMQKNEESEQLRDRIKHGANPDMTQRPVSSLYAFEVPITCVQA